MNLHSRGMHPVAHVIKLQDKSSFATTYTATTAPQINREPPHNIITNIRRITGNSGAQSYA
jgi:hypothetical protein